MCSSLRLQVIQPGNHAWYFYWIQETGSHPNCAGSEDARAITVASSWWRRQQVSRALSQSVYKPGYTGQHEGVTLDDISRLSWKAGNKGDVS